MMRVKMTARFLYLMSMPTLNLTKLMKILKFSICGLIKMASAPREIKYKILDS